MKLAELSADERVNILRGLMGAFVYVKQLGPLVFLLWVGRSYVPGAPRSQRAREHGVELPQQFDAWFDQVSRGGFTHGAGALRTLLAWTGTPMPPLHLHTH